MLWGALGATMSTVLSELAVTGYQLYVLRNQIKYRSLFTDTEKYLLAGFIMFLVIFSIDGKLDNSWTMLIIEVLVGIIIYVILLIVMKAKIVKDAKKMLRS
jgi:O-antigen/teichoic acid export membrane protein